MPAKELILAIDHGTQSVRALVFDPRGRLMAKSRVFIEPYISPQPGWAEQDPDYYWEMVAQACQKLWQSGQVSPSALAGVTLTTQRSTVINVDKQGKPLRRAIVWLDQRRTEGLTPPKGLWGILFTLTGNRETISYLQAEAEANWIAVHEPEVWKNTYKYLFLSGYLAYKFTGRFVDSIAAQVGYVPFDYRRHRWAARWDWKWKVLPIEREMLPDLIPPAQELGRISRLASEKTGIPEGLPLIASAADKACEVLGAGCLEPHQACLSYGTTATINTTHKHYLEAIPMIPPYPAAIPGHYSLEIMIYRGFWMVNWFKQEFAHQEQQLAEEKGVEVEELLEELLKYSPPGARGLILQPYWSPGLKVPGPEARGAIIGFGDVHNRAHLYRAIIEGLAYALREGKERLEKRSGLPITDIRVAGGGSQSDSILQLSADLFGLAVTRPHVYEASGLGAAIDASVGLGIHPDFSTAIREMVHPGKTFEPNPHIHEIYDSLYQRVYKEMYRRLRPLYEEIKKIIG
ncbi:MAG TPA: FGGY-family carbohydrate kinase [Syntrophales bacterium]|nr:FGGY-family carbohydrate kinase [Syntrophales bacterium]HOL58420.1 FGGY-family carbohydrate kinase [Syntrophales bacterium]HPO34589.1 FGGY-family carbohydrate kinase [Syntrophales bacterium]